MKVQELKLASEYADTCSQLLELHGANDAKFLKTCDVIGMTITGASKKLKQLAAVKCPVVLVRPLCKQQL